MPIKLVDFVGTSMEFQLAMNLFPRVSNKKHYEVLVLCFSFFQQYTVTQVVGCINCKTSDTSSGISMMSVMYRVRALRCIRLLPSLLDLLRFATCNFQLVFNSQDPVPCVTSSPFAFHIIMILFGSYCSCHSRQCHKRKYLHAKASKPVNIILIFGLLFTDTKLTPIQFGNKQKMDGPTEQCADPIPPSVPVNCSAEFVRTTLLKICFLSVKYILPVFGENLLELEKIQHEYDSTIGLERNFF